MHFHGMGCEHEELCPHQGSALHYHKHFHSTDGLIAPSLPFLLSLLPPHGTILTA